MIRANKRARRTSMALLAAAGAAVSLASTATRAATVTWAGTISDPLSGGVVGGYTSNIVAYQTVLLYNWNAADATTPVQNWKDGGGPLNFTKGDNVIFDGTSTGRNIYIPDDGMNPATMTFRNADASQVFTFHRAGGSGFPGDFQKAPNELGGTDDLAAKSPWSVVSYSGTLTLESSFLGKVILRARPANGAGVNNTIINGGILEMNDGGALPATSNTNNPNVTLGGGELHININTVGNIQPATGQISGTLTVSENSILAAAAQNQTRVWGGTNSGTLNIAAGKTLTVKSLNGFRAEIGAAMDGATNLGTLRLEDVGMNTTQVGLVRVNTRMPNAILDTGSGQSELMNIIGGTSNNVTFGGLMGGASTKLSGSNQSGTATTYTLGTKAIDIPNGFNGTITFNGVIQDGTGGNVGVLKQGSTTTQVLAGINTYTGSTASSNGTLVLGGANGSSQNTSALIVNSGGTIKLDNATNNNDRLSTSSPIQLQGGTFEFNGNIAAGTNENAGQLQVNSLSSTVRASSVNALSSPAKITFTSLTRSTGFVDFVLNNDVRLNFASAPSVVNGILDGAYATANGSDWATITSGGGDNYVTAYTGYVTDIMQPDPALWTSADNIRITGSSVTIASNVTINSLKLDGGTTLSIGAGNTLNLGTGGILAGSSGAATASTFSGATGTLTATSQIGAMIANSGSSLTIGVPLADSSGPLAVTKNGAGTMVLSATGTATGATTVGQGTLNAGATNAIPSGLLTVDGGATVGLSTFNQSVSGVDLKNGTISGTGATTLTVTGNATNSINVTSGTISARLGGANAGLTKTGGGTVTLSNTNTYGGGTYVLGGTLTATVANAFPSGGGTLEVRGGGTLNLGTNNASVSTLRVGDSFSATPTLGTVTGSGIITLGATLLGEAGTVNTILDGAAGVGVTKSAANTTNGQATELTLTNLANTYDGPTTVNVGGLIIMKMTNGGTTSSIGDSSNAASNLIFNGGRLRYSSSGTNTNGVTDRLFTLNGDMVLDAAGGNNSPWQFTNANAMAGGGFVLQLDGGSQGANQMGVRITDNTTTLAATKIYKKSNSTWALTNNTNSFTGSVELFGGILSVANINNGGAAGPLGMSSNSPNNLVFQIGNAVSQTSGTLRYTGAGQTTDRLFFLNGGGFIEASGTGAIDFTNTGAMGGGGYILTLTGTNTGDNTLRAHVGGSNPFNTGITKTGAGTWVLTNANNNYDFPTTLRAGILKVSLLADGGQASHIGAGDNTAASLVFNGGTLQYGGAAVTTDRLFTLDSFVGTNDPATATSTIDSSGSGAMNFANTGDMGTRTAWPTNVVRTDFKFVPHTLQLQGSNTGANTIAANIASTTITDGTAKTVYATSVSKAGAGNWRLTGALTYTGTTTVSAGTLAVASSIPRTSSVTISGGKLELEASNGARIIKTGALSITGGKLDLHDNRLITTTSAGTPTAGVYSGVQGMVQTARSGGTWAGNGLTTSETDALGSTAVTTIGVATGAQALGLTGSNTGTWGGQTVTATSVLAMYTYAGDATLSGVIDGDDFFKIDAGYVASSTGYANGDFNYSGNIDADDYFLIDKNYVKQFSVSLAPPAGVTAVPEPGSIVGLALGGLGLLQRRRRR